MNVIKKSFLLLLLIVVSISAQEKRVLVEVFTNSFCPLCPPAHTTLDNYLQSSNGDKIEYIYYHMSFPYPQDELNIHNKPDASAKNDFYGPYGGTPKSFFNGTLVTNSYSNWATELDNLVAEQSDFSISLNGTYDETNFTVNADVILVNDITTENLTINFVVVENVNYTGGNGISNHKNVMRKIANPQGEDFTISYNESRNLSSTFTKNIVWNTNNLSVVVFVQNKSTKEVYQSSSISYNDLAITSIEDNSIIKNNFQLYQNYPNPFNPTTTIEYEIADNINLDLNTNEVNLKIYNILGKEISTLVNEYQKPGNYKIKFDATDLPSGQYFYQLKVGNFTEVKKLILLK